MRLAAIALTASLVLAVPASAINLSSMPRDREKEAFVRNFLRTTLALEMDIRVVVDRSLIAANTISAYAALEAGAHYIAINPTSVVSLTDTYSIGTLYHEIGHIVGGHVSTVGKTAVEEDRIVEQFVGWAYARSGASLDDALAYAALGNEHRTSTHIGRAERMKAVEAGWRLGAGEATDVATSPATIISPPASERLGSLAAAARKQIEALRKH